MSSPDKTETNVPGHAPAAKVGGMRVRTRSKGDSTNEKITSDEMRKQEEEYGTEVQTRNTGSLIQGTVVEDKKAFPPEAVKSFHEKPHSTHEKPTKPVIHNIHQPR